MSGMISDQKSSAEQAPGGVRRETFAAYVTDEESLRAIQHYIADLSLTNCSVHLGGINAAIARCEREASPQALLVDLTDAEPAASKVTQLAEFCDPDVVVLAIGDRNDVSLFRNLMRSGVRDYVVKPLPRNLLHEALNDLLGISAPVERILTQRLGRVVTVVGTRGGVGATTIATNIAWGLANHKHRRVALLDLDLTSRACGLMLGVSTDNALREALERPQRVDSLFLDRAMVPCDQRLYLLAGKDDPDDPIKLAPEALPHLISLLRKSFHYVVIDAPRTATTLVRQALHLAGDRAIVLDQTMLSIRDMLQMKALIDEPREGQQNFLILNRVGESGKEAITLKTLEETVDMKNSATVPFDAPNAVSASNAGIPVVSGSGPVGKALKNILETLGGTLLEPPKRWWQRLT
jgi:pilus assembly protein CpaE